MLTTKNPKERPVKAAESGNAVLAEKEHTAPDAAGPGRFDTLFKYLLGCALVLFFFFYFLKLSLFLGDTHFWGDENFHAYVSSVISENRTIPFVLPDDIYGGHKYTYPPFFHVLSAIVMSFAGFAALKYINICLLIIFLFCFFTLIRKYYGWYEAVIACLVLSMSPVLAVNALRYLTEMLSMVLVFFSFFFVLLALKNTNKGFAVIAGLATGLLLLSKQVGLVVLAYYIILLAWFFLKKKEDTGIMLLVIGISLFMYVPYLILTLFNKIDLFGFVSTWMGGNVKTVKMFQQFGNPLKEFVFLFHTGNRNIMSLSVVLPLYYFIRVRTKESPMHYAFLMMIFLAGAMVAWHISHPRHTIILLPMIAFFTGYSFVRLDRKKYMAKIVIPVLLIIACDSLSRMPDFRYRSNPTDDFIRITRTVKADEDASGGRIFSMFVFDVMMHTGKPVIWPKRKLRNIPLDLVEKQNSSEFYRLLATYRIKYIFIFRSYLKACDAFDGKSYPHYFYQNCMTLSNQGKMTVLQQSGDIVAFKVI